MKILITGGAGFIGSALIRHIIKETNNKAINIDKLTYAGNLDSLLSIERSNRYLFEKVDICNFYELNKLFFKHKPDVVMHLAAESHVDNSINHPSEFIQTNILGTFNLLEAANNYYQKLDLDMKGKFRFHHISTDEVYGDLKGTNNLFTEHSSYHPSSPYSASKASSDHLVRAWGRTYQLPVIITNCSNNYGPHQFIEKLIPSTIINGIQGKPISVYGNGLQIRDWLYVDDHVEALMKVVNYGEIGATYNIGGHNEKTNLEVVNLICKLLQELAPDSILGLKNYCDLITFVKDRPGHDERYAIDASKIKLELGWTPKESFESGLRKTVKWYLDNSYWWKRVISGAYRFEHLGK